MLMAESPLKKNVNFNMPEPLHREFEAIAETVGGKQKWVAISAAILMLIESTPSVRRYFIQRVAAADIGEGGWAELIEEAKSGRLREEVEERADIAGARPDGGDASGSLAKIAPKPPAPHRSAASPKIFKPTTPRKTRDRGSDPNKSGW